MRPDRYCPSELTDVPSPSDPLARCTKVNPEVSYREEPCEVNCISEDRCKYFLRNANRSIRKVGRSGLRLLDRITLSPSSSSEQHIGCLEATLGPCWRSPQRLPEGRVEADRPEHRAVLSDKRGLAELNENGIMRSFLFVP